MGPDLDSVHVRDDQERGIAQVSAVLQELIERLIEIGTLFLVFPREKPLLEDIRKSTSPPAFLTFRSVVNVNPLGSTSPGLG
jgi:hypothetical protein